MSKVLTISNKTKKELEYPEATAKKLQAMGILRIVDGAKEVEDVVEPKEFKEGVKLQGKKK